MKFLYRRNPDSIAITEAWLFSDIADSEFTPPHHTCFRKYRRIHVYTPGTYTVEDRGGVPILIKDNLNPTLFIPGNADADILWVTISPQPNIQWQVGVCYRPEDQAHVLQKINNSVNAIENSNCFLLGDFNFTNIDWSKREGNSQLEKSVIDTLNNNLLIQMVDKPTRGNNILRCLHLRPQLYIYKLEVEERFALSDHRSIKVLIRCPVVRITYQSRNIYLYSKGNYEAINKEIKRHRLDQKI